MAIYTVHAPASYGTDVRTTDDKVVFVRDGFYFWAFVAALIWLIWHRLWLALFAYIAISVAAEIVFKWIGLGIAARFVVMIVFALLMGFEAGTLRRWKLSRGKWRQLAVISARNEEEAEQRFFDRWTNVGRDNDIGNPPALHPMPRAPLTAQDDVLGVFPQSGAPR
jgi:hypothetical protein